MICPHCGTALHGWHLAEIGWDYDAIERIDRVDERTELGEAGA